MPENINETSDKWERIALQKNPVIRFAEDVNYVAPQTDIHDSPTKCLKYNAEWSPIIEGWLSWLLEIAAWKDVEREDYSGIQGITKMLLGACDVNCEDVENCLETSATIGTIESDIVTLNSDVDNIETDVSGLQEDVAENAQSDGNVYPAYPDSGTEPDGACGAAYYTVAQVRAFIVDMEAASTTYPDLLTAAAAFMASALNVVFVAVLNILSAWFSAMPPTSVLTEFDATTDDMAELLYCNGFDKATFEQNVRDLGNTRSDDIADFVACIGLGTWNQWVHVGSTDDTQDCSGFCNNSGWVEYDFTISDYGFTVWTTGNRPFGTYVAGVGWKCTWNNVSGDWDNRVYIEKINMSQNYDMTDVEVDYIANAMNSLGKGSFRCTIGTNNQFNSQWPNGDFIVDGQEHMLATLHEDNQVDGLRLTFTTDTNSANPDAIIIKRARIRYINGNPPEGGVQL